MKILIFWSRSKVCLVQAFSLSFSSFFIFFFFIFLGGSDPGQISGSVRVGPGLWANGSAVDDVIHDVTVLERVARAKDDVIHDVIGHVRHVRALAVLIGAWL